jgi:hypothetical protein
MRLARPSSALIFFPNEEKVREIFGDIPLDSKMCVMRSTMIFRKRQSRAWSHYKYIRELTQAD